jgi:hypothetical protein
MGGSEVVGYVAELIDAKLSLQRRLTIKRAVSPRKVQELQDHHRTFQTLKLSESFKKIQKSEGDSMRY